MSDEGKCEEGNMMTEDRREGGIYNGEIYVTEIY